MMFDAAEFAHLAQYGEDENWNKSIDGRIIAKLCAQVLDLQADRKWVASFGFLGGFITAGILFTWVLR